MKSKKTFSCLILIISPFFFGCEPLPGQNKNNASASSISLHVGNEKYFIIDTKESVVAWKGSSVEGVHTGYVDISKGELMIENGRLVGGTVEVDMNTIEDNNHGRDNNLIKHLKSPDFFDVEKYPQLNFTGKKYNVEDNEGTLAGELTMHGITKPVTLNVEFGGIVTDPYGQTKAGFTVTGKINRKDFGLSWGGVTETGGVVLGDEVKINAEIQLIKKADVLVEEEELAEHA